MTLPSHCTLMTGTGPTTHGVRNNGRYRLGEFATRYADNPYDGELAYVDDEIGRLLQALESGEHDAPTLVAVLSDHGEALGGHGERTHGIFLYDETIRIPVVMARIGAEEMSEPRVYDGILRGMDLFPTLMGLVGIDSAVDIDGVDVLTREGPSATYSETYAPLESFNWSELRALRTVRWKYVLAPDGGALRSLGGPA